MNRRRQSARRLIVNNRNVRGAFYFRRSASDSTYDRFSNGIENEPAISDLSNPLARVA
jgi:hypothetical protein